MKKSILQNLTLSLLTILNFSLMVCQVPLRLTAYDFRLKGWNSIYCQPKCRYSCELICVAETGDRWQGCIFADPNGYPCYGKKRDNNFSKNDLKNVILS